MRKSVYGRLFVTIIFLTAMQSFTASALDPATLLFDQPFNSLEDISADGGICTLQGIACTASIFEQSTSGNAIKFKKTNYPLVSFPVTLNGNQHIKPLKGTVTFDYVPAGSPDGDWGSTPSSKVFFQLRDPNGAISVNSTLVLGTYYDPPSGKHYLYFRYDGTNGCSATYPPPAGVPYCQREISTSSKEPDVIMKWAPGTRQKVTASWDFTATRPYMLLFLGGDFAIQSFPNKTINLDGFNPALFYVGSLNGSQSAQGSMDNLKIYEDVVLDTSNPVPSYIEQTHNNGGWQPHETIHDSSDAPAAIDLAGQPFIFYNSYAFEPVYEGSVPAIGVDVEKFTVDTAKNQIETAFFNIYAGENDLGVVTASVSDLVSSNATITQDQIKIRAVKNWWQAGKEVFKEIIPVYTPELLLYDGTQTPQCTGTGTRPCAGSLFPSDPKTIAARTNVKAQTSRQFALTVDVPATAATGVYTGIITIATQQGTKTLPIEINVRNIVLPEIDKTVAIYNHSSFDLGPTHDMYVTEDMYKLQLQNMHEHGINGAIYYGAMAEYPKYAQQKGLSHFGAYVFDGNVDWASTLVNQLLQILDTPNASFTPYLYGVDEPGNVRSNGRNLIPEHLSKSKVIHTANGKVVVAIDKTWSDRLNDPSFFPYTDELGRTYTFAEGKLDLANIAVESGDSTTQGYFDGLLKGTITKVANPEVYYWQMDREDSRINRFYTGYHLWLTDLAGVFPYVYQKLLNDPFNDFDQASLSGERDLNVVYPSQEGGIDTIQWEAFRAGIDDYRLLQLWRNLHNQISLQPNNNAATRKTMLDSIVAKYRNTKAFRTTSSADFANDRNVLLVEVEAMTADMADDDQDGVGHAFDNCTAVANANQADRDSDGLGNMCDPYVIESFSVITNKDNEGTIFGAWPYISKNFPLIYIGDNGSNDRFIGVLDFTLPSDLISVTSVQLQVTRAGAEGNPIDLGSNINVDMTVGAFSGNPALQLNDAIAIASVPQAAALPPLAADNTSYLAEMTAEALGVINSNILLTRTVQFRLSMPSNTDNDQQSDRYAIPSEDNANVIYRPKIIVTGVRP